MPLTRTLSLSVHWRSARACEIRAEKQKNLFFGHSRNLTRHLFYKIMVLVFMRRIFCLMIFMKMILVYLGRGNSRIWGSLLSVSN